MVIVSDYPKCGTQHGQQSISATPISYSSSIELQWIKFMENQVYPS